jgi:hypothetical protein
MALNCVSFAGLVGAVQAEERRLTSVSRIIKDNGRKSYVVCNPDLQAVEHRLHNTMHSRLRQSTRPLGLLLAGWQVGR